VFLLIYVYVFILSMCRPTCLYYLCVCVYIIYVYVFILSMCRPTCLYYLCVCVYIIYLVCVFYCPCIIMYICIYIVYVHVFILSMCTCLYCLCVGLRVYIIYVYVITFSMWYCLYPSVRVYIVLCVTYVFIVYRSNNKHKHSLHIIFLLFNWRYRRWERDRHQL